MTSKPVPAAEGLFTQTPEGARLIGSRCVHCRTPYFPRTAFCHNPDCGKSELEDAYFGPRGSLWSCAIQNYPPPPPAKFDEPYKPYAVGLVDLDDGLRVLGRIHTDDVDALRVGVQVELVLEPLCTEADGDTLISWQFRPL